MRSVRARAALGATTVVAAALVTAGLLMLAVLQRNLHDRVDLRAELSAREVATEVATGTGDVADLDLDASVPVQVLDGDDERVVLAVSEELEAISGTPTDRVVPGRPGQGRSPAPAAREDGDADDDAGDDDPGDDGDDDTGDDRREDEDDQAPLRPGEVAQEPERVVDGSAVIDGERDDYRFVALRARTAQGDDVTVYAGAPLDVERAALDSVRTSMLVGIPALLAVVAGVTWLVTRRALRPVEGIRREMAEITRSADLSRRVPEPASRDEIERLARTTNETLAALEASVERQRRFVADASHELRSPIASLRTQLEVGEAHPELLDVSGAVQDTVRLQDLAADLLLLARLDAGERPATSPVELARLVTDEVARRTGARTGARAPVPVRTAELDDVTVSASPGQLARVVGNLLDNAQRHAASAVRVSVRRAGHGRRATAVVEVADDGSGVPEADRERIFERFVRLDDARSRDDGGAGLGLAIARDVAERHGGTLTAGPAPEGGALFTLRLPAAD